VPERPRRAPTTRAGRRRPVVVIAVVVPVVVAGPRAVVHAVGGPAVVFGRGRGPRTRRQRTVAAAGSRCARTGRRIAVTLLLSTAATAARRRRHHAGQFFAGRRPDVRLV